MNIVNLDNRRMNTRAVQNVTSAQVISLSARSKVADDYADAVARIIARCELGPVSPFKDASPEEQRCRLAESEPDRLAIEAMATLQLRRLPAEALRQPAEALRQPAVPGMPAPRFLPEEDDGPRPPSGPGGGGGGSIRARFRRMAA